MSALHPDDREQIVTRWGSTVEARAGYTTPAHRFVQPSGEIVSVEVRAVPLAGPLGDRNFLGILEDVTGAGRRRGRAGRAPGAGRGGAQRGGDGAQGGGGARGPRWTASSRASPMPSWRSTLEGRYTYANDRAIAMLGRPRDQLIGQTAYALFPRIQGERDSARRSSGRCASSAR